MALLDPVQEAFQALIANKMRSGLTMLGVIIGVAAVILLVAVGQGAKNYITGELSGLGTNIIIITPGKLETKGGFGAYPLGTTHKLTLEDAEALERRAYTLSGVAPLVLGTMAVKQMNMSRNTTIIGTWPEFQQVRNLHVEIGDFVSREDSNARRRVVVIGRKVKEQLFGDSDPLGSMVTIGDSRYRVIGIMQKKGHQLGIDIDDVVFIPLTSGQELFDTDSLFEILVQAREGGDRLSLAERQIKEIITHRHANREDFTVTTQNAMMETTGNILNILTYVLGGIAGISLVVGGVGIMNIMLVSVKERTREIGIRKAVGAKRGDIMRQFLTESIIISLSGGIIGILLGGGVALSLPLIFPALPMTVSTWSVVTAFTFSFFVGIFFGVYPARQASRLDPIQALRYE